MTVCPNCGEPIINSWRQNRWRTNVYFLQWDQTSDIDPVILQKLKDNPKEIQLDNYYAYRNAKRVIERILRDDFLAGGKQAFSIPREHINHKKDPKQRKLLDVKS